MCNCKVNKLEHIQSSAPSNCHFPEDAPSFVNETVPARTENKSCDGFAESVTVNNTVSYCNVDGYISNYTCPADQIWDDDYAQCTSPLSMCPFSTKLHSLNTKCGRDSPQCQSRASKPRDSFEKFFQGQFVSVELSNDGSAPSLWHSDRHMSC